MKENMYNNLESICGKYPTAEALKDAIRTYLPGNEKTIENLAKMYESDRGININTGGK